MKFISILLLSIIIILTSLIIHNIYGISNIEKLKDNPPNSTSTTHNVIQKSHQFNNTAKNTTILYSVNNIDTKVKGVLNVIITVDNKNIGNKTPSDFIIIVHANDPSPSSFSGNAFGTKVKLGMGMYSVSESSNREYVSKYSSDCFGGIMSATVKKCIITNIYTNTSSSN